MFTSSSHNNVRLIEQHDYDTISVVLFFMYNVNVQMHDVYIKKLIPFNNNNIIV